MSVEPIYGYGWTVGRGDVPEPLAFTIEAKRSDSGAIFGHIVASGDARLRGAASKAKQRHVSVKSLYNCQIECKGGVTLARYCKIK